MSHNSARPVLRRQSTASWWWLVLLIITGFFGLMIFNYNQNGIAEAILILGVASMLAICLWSMFRALHEHDRPRALWHFVLLCATAVYIVVILAVLLF